MVQCHVHFPGEVEASEMPRGSGEYTLSHGTHSPSTGSQAQGSLAWATGVDPLTFVPVSITGGAQTSPLVITKAGIPRGLESNSKQTAGECKKKLEGSYGKGYSFHPERKENIKQAKPLENCCHSL